MNKHRDYSGIDFFRMVAALLIVAIHVSPLSGISASADFVLTRIFARLAVPFFFMTSGFFLISRHTSGEKLLASLKKTGWIYAIAIVIYIPINIYNGYFRQDELLPNLIRDLVFDGTLYHLWYLPASMMGAAIAWYLVKKLDYKKALICTGFLYGIGLLGDSYYGFSTLISANGFIDLLLQLFDYTRNGLFFAPVFFVLGGWIAQNPRNIRKKQGILYLGISLLLMTVEATVLHKVGWPRWDSMYIALLPCTFFLFSLLLQVKGPRHVLLRDISLVTYIIHPMMIVAVRLGARILHLEALLVENNLMHYIVVCVTSVVFSLIVVWLRNKYKSAHPKYDSRTERAYLEIDTTALTHNIRTLNAALQPGCELMAVLKAEAYGHGGTAVATCANRAGVNAFAVAAIDEGIQLRRSGVTGVILVLGYTAPARAKDLHKYDLTQALISYDHAVALNEQGYPIKAHIKIDSGMHRLGFAYPETRKILRVFSMKKIHVTGIFTHLSCADSLTMEDTAFTEQQIRNFYSVIDVLKANNIPLPKIHIQSSYGLLNYPELQCDYVRIGVSLYGVLSAKNDMPRLQLDLKPVLSLKSRVVLLRTIPKGESVGYNRAFTTQRDSLVAILPIGYADGYPRNLSYGCGHVLINGTRAPVIGKICMDQLAVDVTDIPNVQLGDIATLIGIDGQEQITAEMVSDDAGTITNEILSRMGRRLKLVTK